MLTVMLEMWGGPSEQFEIRTEVLKISGLVSEYITTIHTHIHSFIHSFIQYIHTYIHTHIYIHTYIHTCRRMGRGKCSKSPLSYLRYLDDILIIWPYSKKEFWNFFDILNQQDDKIKLKATISDQSVDFFGCNNLQSYTA